jgi:ligand-binding sensor domain-containing protein
MNSHPDTTHIAAIIVAIGTVLCWFGCHSDDDPVSSSSHPMSDAALASDAGLPDDVPDAQVEVRGEWVNFISGGPVYAIADGPDDVWIGTAGGLVRYQKPSGQWYFYDHGNSGLPCNRILSLALDQQGKIWVGTEHNGLARFDGENWLDLQIDDQQSHSPRVVSMYVDPQRTLWVGTDTGYLYAYDGGNWVSYNLDNPVAAYVGIFGTVADNEGRFWVATQDGLGTLDKVSGTWTRDTTFPLGGIKELSIDGGGSLWVGTGAGVAQRVDGVWATYDTSNSPIPNNTVSGLSEDPTGGMWLGTCGGLAHLDGLDWQVNAIPDAKSTDQCIFSVASSSDATAWVGTYRQGLFRLKDGVFTSEKTTPSGYPGTNAYSFAEVGKGIIWMGMSEGLARWQHGQWTLFNTKNSPLPSSAMAIAVGNDSETLWVGTPKGLAKLQGDKWDVFDSTNSGLPNSEVNDVLVDRIGRVWVATSAGLSVYDGTSWQTFTRSNSPLPSNRIYSLALDKQANLWIGILTDWADSGYVPGGLAKHDGQEFKVFTTQNSGLPIDHILGVAVDENDVVWLATGSPDGPAYQDQGGLVSFDGNAWRTFTTENSSLPSNYVDCVTADKHGSIWVGTYEGLAKYDGNQWQVWHHNDSGLSDEVIWKILVDHRGNTWIGTGFEGLSVYKPGGVEFEM